MRATAFGPDAAARLYNLEAWSAGYFALQPDGQLAVRGPDEQLLALSTIMAQAREAGFSAPLLLRFEHILRDRARALSEAFDAAITSQSYRGRYTPVYPIKVNQQGAVIRALVADERVGLEAGSKSELLGVLGLLPVGRPIICNGYKDAAYIRLALVAESLGHPTTLVIEKLSEIGRIAALAAELGVRPRLGLRVRLAAVSKGRWQNTGGEKSKFGLSAPQVQEALQQLGAHQLLSQLNLVHCHLGSQVANLRDIRGGLRELARYFVALREAGAPIHVVDVGGGLAVDYDGTRSRASCSMNYSLADYAAAVITALRQAADAVDAPHPDVITESGRALTAHHAVLLANVVDVETLAPPPVMEVGPGTAALLRELAALQRLPLRPLECLDEGRHLLEQVQAAFTRGEISFTERAQAENLWLHICFAVRDSLDPGLRSQRQALDRLREQLADRLFCNFSLFQSLPDAWAIDQVFPIMPLQRLHQRPERMALIRDLTCDSDGRIDEYVDRDGLETTLPVHDIDPAEDYLLGFFLVGAYQEILGDMHNLFGDTDAANVVFDDAGQWRLEGLEHGDKAEELLEYVHVPGAELRRVYRDKLQAAELEPRDREKFSALLESALSSTTYLD